MASRSENEKNLREIRRLRRDFNKKPEPVQSLKPLKDRHEKKLEWSKQRFPGKKLFEMTEEDQMSCVHYRVWFCEPDGKQKVMCVDCGCYLFEAY